jgi:hypothetical protein
MSSQNLYVDTLISNIIVFGCEASGRLKNGALITVLLPLGEETQGR